MNAAISTMCTPEPLPLARLQLGTLLDPWHRDSPQDLHHTERLLHLVGSTLFLWAFVVFPDCFVSCK